MNAKTFLVTGSVLLLGGCTTEGYCFADCEDLTLSQARGGSGGENNLGLQEQGGAGGAEGGTGGQAQDCTAEICDGLDNDCDDVADEDFTDEDGNYTTLDACGNCETNCRQVLKRVLEPRCTPPETNGDAGVCTYDECDADYYDIDGYPGNGCEYHCPHNPDGSVTVDADDECGRDDDCDGLVDENVDTCGADNCGDCGKKCVVANGSAECVKTGLGATCTEENTECQVAGCEAGWYDIDGLIENGCEYKCPFETAEAEVCDGLDNDCDGLIDNADPDLESDSRIGVECFGGDKGECATAAHAGVSKCIGGAPTCCDAGSNQVTGQNPHFPSTGVRNGVCDATSGPLVLRPDEQLETCDGADNDCDGVVDDKPTDVGGQCGTSLGSCETGTIQCISGKPECRGAVGASPDICNGADDNCDGIIDGVVALPLTACTSDTHCQPGQYCRSNGAARVCATETADAGTVCDVPPVGPPINPCRAGTLRCIGATLSCEGSIKAVATRDECGEDTNCSGAVEAESQPDFQTDVNHCGGCNTPCGADPTSWSCVDGQCEQTGCPPGRIDCSGNPDDCETACTPSGPERCNGIDDDCDCEVDEDISPRPAPTQVCNVAPGATDPGCQEFHPVGNPGGVQITCREGAWACDFSSDYCDSTAWPEYCQSRPDVCDGLDNNCNGGPDDDFQQAVRSDGYLGQTCASDEGQGVTHGACRTTAVYVCDGPDSTRCAAEPNWARRSDEECDGEDNDCDGSVDETYERPGAQPSYVKPAVIQTGASTWMFQYEASRPAATLVDPKKGAPSLACSRQGVAPWFNIEPHKAAEVCEATGGHLCSLQEWQGGCQPDPSCLYAYGPRDTACAELGAYAPQGDPSCNIALYDFNDQTPVNGTQGPDNGMLPTGYLGGVASAPALAGCWADWGGRYANTGDPGDPASGIHDMLGNLREITWDALDGGFCDPVDPDDPDCEFPLMGGAFNTETELGASCDYSFYSVDSRFKLFDVGFRCCFDSDPR